MAKKSKTSEENREFKIAYIFLYLLTFIIVLGSVSYGVMQYQAMISNKSGVNTESPLMALSGKLPGSDKIESLDWGLSYPDSYTERTFWVYNDHPQNNMDLYLTTANWLPKEAPDYIKIEWDLENFNLTTRAAVKATVRLTVSKDVKDIINFSFDIIITGVEQ